MRDYYDVLGVPRDADEAAIKKAFRGLARELHPDVNRDDPDTERKFKEAAEAYEVLSDPEKRATYDRYGHDGLRRGGYAPNFDVFGSMSDIFEAFFGGGGLGGFGSPFGGRSGPAPGRDVAVTVEVDLAQAFEGADMDVAYDAVAVCEDCRGNGAEPGTPIEACARCNGSGQLRGVTRTPFGQVVRATACDVCHGEGRVARNPCPTCDGRGRLVRRQSLRVAVPAGIEDGQRIRLAGRGHAGESGGPPGDIYVLVRVREHERFMRDGDDLITVVDVAAPFAALGTTAEVDGLDGPVEVDIPPGTQPSAMVVVSGRGMPALRRGRRGDLRVVVNVVVPRRLSRRQRDLMEELARSMHADNLRSDEGVFAKLKRAFGG